MKTTGHRGSRAITTIGVVVAGAAFLLSGCTAQGGASSGSEQTDSGGAITVWVDPPRVPAADAFVAAHPEIDVTVNQIDGTVGGKSLQQQFAQFDQAGKGWPDAIFFPSNDDIAWATGSQSGYAADLTDLLPDVIDGYDEAVIAPCDFDGAIRCLRNDAAPDVFWYDAVFFQENGYTPPTTWEGYADLAVEIAAAHPGKVSGFLGDAYAPDRYLRASGCPTNDRRSATEVRIDLEDPSCTRAKDLLSTMVDGDAVSDLGIFDADAASVGAAGLVMSPGALWWGDYLFKQTWKIPAGTMSATAPLTWEGDTEPSTGSEGGGLWGVSSHITGKQLENTLIFAEFVATDPAWQVELSTGLPAFAAVQDAWIEKQKAADYFFDDDATFAAFKAATGQVVGGHSYMLYNTGGIWTESMVPALVSGASVDEAWSDFATELTNQAETFGYSILGSE